MSYTKEVIHNFACIYCNRFWSIALHFGGDHNIIDKKLYCPWCGHGHRYITDDDYKGIKRGFE